jgi:hypothetical protein
VRFLRPLSVALLAVVATVLPTGCASTGTPGAGCSPQQCPSPDASVPTGATVGFTWSSGSVAPPWNHTWTVAVDPTGAGTLTFAAGDQKWSGGYTALPAALTAFRDDAAALLQHGAGVTGHPVGGPSGVLTVTGTVAGTAARELTVQSDQPALDELSARATSVVPQEVWKSVEGQYETWRDAHRN